MFNVFSQTPGFRVRPQDDVPGFDIDENGLPRRDRTWSDGTPPGSATPQGVTPVNCTIGNGILGCTSPGGESFGVNPSNGFPGQLDSNTGDYHGYSIPDGPHLDSEQALTQHIINFPTPGPKQLIRPATLEGTPNEATPWWARDYMMGNAAAAGAVLPPDGPLNPVKSYLTTDQNGKQIVVNVTEPGHILHPGYVVRHVTSSNEGSTIQNEGEGSAFWQGPFFQRIRLADWLNNEAWRGLYREQMGSNKDRP